MPLTDEEYMDVFQQVRDHEPFMDLIQHVTMEVIGLIHEHQPQFEEAVADLCQPTFPKEADATYLALSEVYQVEVAKAVLGTINILVARGSNG